VSHYNTILHQLLTLIPRHHFDRLVEDLDGDRYVKTFSTWNQLTTLLYAQASGKDSLREIVNGLAAHGSRSYHLGLAGAVTRSTLADANANRDWRIYEGLFYKLLERCRALAPRQKFNFKSPLFSLDATVIDLCLASFPWAKFRQRKGALKLHYKLEHAGELPVFLKITDGKEHEISVAKSSFPLVPDSIYCFDRAYIDWSWFRRILDGGSHFVTRYKRGLKLRWIGTMTRKKGPGVIADLLVEPDIPDSREVYPAPMRLIVYRDRQTGKTLRFLTSRFDLAATTIAQIYKARWQIEIFFKWIKQNLKIKTFLGTSKNAVMTQVWVAMCYFLLLAYVKFQARFAASLFYLGRLVREFVMSRVSLIDLLRLNAARLDRLRRQDLQLCLQF